MCPISNLGAGSFPQHDERDLKKFYFNLQLMEDTVCGLHGYRAMQTVEGGYKREAVSVMTQFPNQGEKTAVS